MIHLESFTPEQKLMFANFLYRMNEWGIEFPDPEGYLEKYQATLLSQLDDELEEEYYLY